MIRRTLLQKRAAQANFVPLKNSETSPGEGEAACDVALAALPRPFDIVVLGMGNDGHTASLFPRATQLKRGLDRHSDKRCIGIDPVTVAHPRMSLTLPALLTSRRIVLLINCADKWDVYRQAVQPWPIEALPIRSILSQTEVPVEVYWSP